MSPSKKCQPPKPGPSTSGPRRKLAHAKPKSLRSGSWVKNTARPPSKAAASSHVQRKKVFRRSKKTFRLLDLPLEIQRMIYDLCLVSSKKIVIRIDNSDGGNGLEMIPRGMAGEYDMLVELTSNHSGIALPGNISPYREIKSSGRSSESLFNVNLLLVSKRIYDETAPVLYSRNDFHFEGEDSLDVFAFFHQRLTAISLKALQVLSLKMPHIRRFCDDEQNCEIILGDFEEWLVEALKGLQGLKRLRLHLDQDIMSSDNPLLDRLGAIPTKKVTLVIGTTPDHSYHWRSRRSTWIHEDAVVKMNRLGWELEGDFQEVDEQHSSYDPKVWIAALKESDRRAVQSGYKKESSFVMIKPRNYTGSTKRK